MNLKEYNYCKRHHPQALSRVLGIKINNFMIYPTWYGIHDIMTFEQENIDAYSEHDNVNRNITLLFLI